MSRVSLIEQLCTKKKKSALEFDYDSLWAPPIRCLISQQDINQLYKICTSVKYNGNINRKYELIDAIMKPRGFKRGNCGTNRVVYNFLEDTSFCFKIAVDKVGLRDSPAEFKNQEYFKPFCCKIFEVDPTGVVACIERVNPVSSFEEYVSIADDIFNMMVTKIIGKYVVDDLGSEYYMNYGIRYNSNGVAFGPVIIDFPYAYELDGAKLKCCREFTDANGKITICNGDIDYDASLSKLICTKCGKRYTAQDLSKDTSSVLKFYNGEPSFSCRAKVVKENGDIILDSGRSSKLYISKEEYMEVTRMFRADEIKGDRKVKKTVRGKKYFKDINQVQRNYYTQLQEEAYHNMVKNEQFNQTVIERPVKIVREANTDSNIKLEEVVNNVSCGRKVKKTINANKEVKDNSMKKELVLETNNEPDIEYGDNTQNNVEIKSDNALSNDVDINNSIIKNDNSKDITDNNIMEDEEMNNKSLCDEIEKDVFPEIGSNASFKEPDYSNYIPPEEDDNKEYVEEDPDYSDYLKNDGKFKKRQNKKERNKHNKQNFDSSMYEY